jgi:hypothetical protein
MMKTISDAEALSLLNRVFFACFDDTEQQHQQRQQQQQHQPQIGRGARKSLFGVIDECMCASKFLFY